jgi:coniferyl-aldehyde dehydrogenase
MNDRTLAVDGSARLADIFEAQQRAFDTQPFSSADERRAHLRALKRQVSRYRTCWPMQSAGTSAGAHRPNR